MLSKSAWLFTRSRKHPDFAGRRWSRDFVLPQRTAISNEACVVREPAPADHFPVQTLAPDPQGRRNRFNRASLNVLHMNPFRVDGSGHLLRTDQRRAPRPDKEDSVGCDMGAYEKQTD